MKKKIPKKKLLDASDSALQNPLIAVEGANWGEYNKWVWRGLYIHWRKLGNVNNKPLLLIHGFGASSSHWRNNVNFFKSMGFCVYAIDLIGFGLSDQPTQKCKNYLNNQFWSEQIIAFLEQIVRANKSKKAIIIGNSLGGLVGINLVANRPDLIDAIIAAPLPDPAFAQPIQIRNSFLKKKIKEYFIKSFFFIFPLGLLVKLIANTGLINFALQGAYFKSIKLDKELKRIVSYPAKRKYASKALRSMCIGMSIRERKDTAPYFLSKLEKVSEKPPILLVWGQKDRLIPLMIGKRLAKQYPWLKLHVLEKTGHCPHDESPIQFNTYVFNWLQRNLKANR